jgi:hypothetical protein
MTADMRNTQNPDAAGARLETTVHLQIDMSDRQAGGRRGKS